MFICRIGIVMTIRDRVAEGKKTVLTNKHIHLVTHAFILNVRRILSFEQLDEEVKTSVICNVIMTIIELPHTSSVSLSQDV
ncbi:hypothetical protein DICVIV_11216 [Dictyocaulus viviparus]|uniref:Uncharacterized protein n=1 Tax=Dictyocaulus viviparus TaxID=29172 RepID=A0A0D8XDT0_DICVI|nr:hypothetical protein DICVIV_11216 [Dictyocaulus viviparus]